MLVKICIDELGTGLIVVIYSDNWNDTLLQ